MILACSEIEKVRVARSYSSQEIVLMAGEKDSVSV